MRHATYSVITFRPTPVSLTALRMPIGIRKKSDMPTESSKPHTYVSVVTYRKL